MKSRKGFTLLELLIVVVIVFVIAGIALPNFSRTHSRLELQDTANRISDIMRYAQSRAILKKQQHRLSFVHGQAWLEEKSIPSKQSSVLSNEQNKFVRIKGLWGRRLTIPSGIEVSPAQGEVDFHPNGMIDKVNLRLCQKAQCLTVSTQQQSGYVQILKEEDNSDVSQ